MEALQQQNSAALAKPTWEERPVSNKDKRAASVPAFSVEKLGQKKVTVATWPGASLGLPERCDVPGRKLHKDAANMEEPLGRVVAHSGLNSWDASLKRSNVCLMVIMMMMTMMSG